MYSRNSSRFPMWLSGLLAALIVFGGYYLWRGLMVFVETEGNIAAPITRTANVGVLRLTETASALETPLQATPLNFLFVTPTAPRPCVDFFVNVVRARVRECPNETCETIDRPYQNNIICVYGPAKEAPDWYEVNLDPKDPIPRIGYMHNSVIQARNPTPRPTSTPRPTRTFTPAPTPRPTSTPLVSATPAPDFLPTVTPAGN